MSVFGTKGGLSIYSAPLHRSPTAAPSEVSSSAFALLFSELVQYAQNRVSSVSDLERRLEEAGYSVGQRVGELVGCRERLTKRETRVVNMLQYVSNTVWKHLFNKVADNLERSTENADEYMIHENSPITNAFISVPADMGQLNCAAFIAGIIAGVLDSAKFNARVTAHNLGDGTERTVFLIKFAEFVMERERRLA
jgi:hypothetical protein